MPVPALVNIYHSGRVTRYHANWKFNNLLQTNADHQWGVVAIILALHPNPPTKLIRKAHFHDGGEFLAGDLPYPFKVEDPELARQHEATEFKLAARAGIPGAEEHLDGEDARWLTFGDRLESYLFAKMYRPEVLEETGWVIQTDVIVATAKALGVYEQIKEIFD